MEPHPERETVAQSCLVRAREFPEVRGFKASKD